MDRNDAGVFLDRHDQRRGECLGRACPALATRIEAGVDTFRQDRPRAQIAVSQCARKRGGMAPDGKSELVEIGFAFLTLARIMIRRSQNLAGSQGGHDRFSHASGKAMKQHGTIAHADGQACLAVRVCRTSTHGEVPRPFAAELANNSIRLFLNRGDMPSGHLRHLR
jgi:hypothetical protein